MCKIYTSIQKPFGNGKKSLLCAFETGHNRRFKTLLMNFLQLWNKVQKDIELKVWVQIENNNGRKLDVVDLSYKFQVPEKQEKYR